jgi:hypothetical protein
MYAKMALLKFYPFCQLTDLICKKNYWKKFHLVVNKKENTLFWKKGFEILQNIQDRDTLQKHVRCARDPICMVTVDEKPDEKKHFQTSFKRDPIQCKMNRTPANLNNGTTGHKLQGMSKDVIIASS